MTKRSFSKKLPIILLISGLMILGSMLINTPSRASESNQQTEEYCLSCHSKPDLKMTLPSGEDVSLYVDPSQLATSVHSPNGIECEACHTNITTYPHPAISF